MDHARDPGTVEFKIDRLPVEDPEHLDQLLRIEHGLKRLRVVVAIRLEPFDRRSRDGCEGQLSGLQADPDAGPIAAGHRGRALEDREKPIRGAKWPRWGDGCGKVPCQAGNLPSS